MILTIFKNLMIKMMIWPFMDNFFSKNIQNNHVCSNDLDGFLLMCEPPDVEPDYLSEANSQNSFAIDVVEGKKTLRFAQLIMLPMEIFKLELKLNMVSEIMNLQYEEVVYFVILHIYWLEKVMNFTGPSQKNTLSRVNVLQPKALTFHYFILKVPCFL